MNYMTDHQAKAMIIEVGKRMFAKNFVAANDGNISCRVADDIIWCTPTGVSKGFMTEDMLVKMDLNGNVLMGNKKPSSEIKMHIRVYQENSEVQGVCHAHPPISTAFAVAGIALDKAIYPEALVNLGTVPIAHYATPGSTDVPDSIAPFCKDYNAVLLANHGALTWGNTLTDAWYRMESLEHYAMILMYTGNIIGKANVLSCDQVSDLIDIRTSMGITGGGVPACNLKPTNMSDVVRSHTMLVPGNDRELKVYDKNASCGCSGSAQAAPAAPAPQPAQTSPDLKDIIDKVTKQVLAALE